MPIKRSGKDLIRYLAGRQFLGVPDVEVITPRYDVIAFDLEDAHRRADLVTVSPLESIQSFRKHAVPVSCNSKHIEISILDTGRLFPRFECRDCSLDAGLDRDTFTPLRRSRLFAVRREGISPTHTSSWGRTN